MSEHKTLAQALAAAQKNIGASKKKADNPFFRSKYSDLGSVIEAVKEALNNEGITILQPVNSEHEVVEGKLSVLQFLDTILLHESGERFESRTFLPTIGDPQKQGAAITYFRRFALQSLLLVPAEDTDGETLIDRGSAPKPTPAASKPPFLGKKG